MDKVTICKAEEEHTNNWCKRCDQYYCLDCISFYEVEDEIIEKIHHNNPHFPDEDINWKGERVCPWCFNQLVDIKNKEEGMKE